MHLNHKCDCGEDNWRINENRINKDIVSDGNNLYTERGNSCILDMIICFDCSIICQSCLTEYSAILPTKYFPHKKWDNKTISMIG